MTDLYNLGAPASTTPAETAVAAAANAGRLNSFQPADEAEKDAYIAELRRRNSIWELRAWKLAEAYREPTYNPFFNAYSTTGEDEWLGATMSEVLGSADWIIRGGADDQKDPEDEGFDADEFTSIPPIRTFH